MKDMTQEEKDAYEDSIPEWKKGALVRAAETEEEQEEARKGIFRRARDKVAKRVNDTEAVQNFKQSEDYEKVNKLRAEYQEFRGDLKEQAENSENMVLRKGMEVTDKVKAGRWENAVLMMKRYDADFDLEDL